MSSSNDAFTAQPATHLHHVHLYALVRIKVSDILAADARSAAEAALGRVDLHDLFDRELTGRVDGISSIDWAEDIEHYLIDRTHDEELGHSVVLDRDFKEVTDERCSYSAVQNRVMRTDGAGQAPVTVYVFAQSRAGNAHAAKIAALLNAAATGG